MGIWQKRLGSWARWWNTDIKVNQPRSQLTWDTLYTCAMPPKMERLEMSRFREVIKYRRIS